jgi:hypothetical protein
MNTALILAVTLVKEDLGNWYFTKDLPILHRLLILKNRLKVGAGKRRKPSLKMIGICYPNYLKETVYKALAHASSASA